LSLTLPIPGYGVDPLGAKLITSPLTVHPTAFWIVANGLLTEFAEQPTASEPPGATKYVLGVAAPAAAGTAGTSKNSASNAGSSLLHRRRLALRVDAPVTMPWSCRVRDALIRAVLSGAACLPVFGDGASESHRGI
jgi:hypothetical protein